MKWYEIVVGIIAWLVALWFYGYIRDCYVRDRYGYFPKFKKDKPYKEPFSVRIKQFFKLKMYRKYYWWVFRIK